MGKLIIGINLLVFLLCLVVGTIELLLYIDLKYSHLLIAGISSLLLASFKLVQISFQILSVDIQLWELILQLCLGLFYLIMGIMINLNFIKQDIPVYKLYHLLISTLFIISLLFINTSFIIHINYYYQHLLNISKNYLNEKDDGQVHPQADFYLQSQSQYQYPAHLQPQGVVLKKVSERTLVDNHSISDVASIVKKSIYKQHGNDDNYILNSSLTDNWMSPSLHTDQFKKPSTVDSSANRANNSERIEANSCKSLHYQQHESSEGLKSNYKCEDIDPRLQIANSVYLIETRAHAKRSKSTSCIGDPLTKMKKRQERWNSINNEKIFLSTVNESLLPSVLKSGESPIMALKRKQSIIDETGVNDATVPVLPNSFSTPPRKRSAPEYYSYSPRHCDSGNELFADDSDDEMNLPHIYEFDEPIDQSNFAEFDQGFNSSPISPREKQVYDLINGSKRTLNIMEHKDKKIIEDSQQKAEKLDTPNDESEMNELEGLETMPKSLTHRAFSWTGAQSQNKLLKNKNSSLQNITIKEWNSNLHLYQEKRQVSGSNIILGLGHIGNTNNNLLPATSSNNNDVNQIDIDHSDLDNISEIQSIYRVSSAPSLHTFRQVSGSSKTSSSRFSAESGMDMTLQIIPDEICTPKLSPVRKFFQESPKRLSIALKKRKVEENHYKRHKHSDSIISNQFSIVSGVSSRSTSPKKSLKSIVSRSHKKSSSVPCAILASPLLSPPQETRIAWDDHNSNSSRVSSVPSVVIGEYDREKWRTLQALQNEAIFVIASNQ